MDESSLSDTKARILRFAAAAKGQGGVLTFMLSEKENSEAPLNGVHGFMHLQALYVTFTHFVTIKLADHSLSLLESDIPCSVLPVPNISALLPTLDSFLKGVQPPQNPPPKPPMSTELLTQATATVPAKPLSEHHANVLSDIFSSLRDFEEATRTRQGQSKLYNFLDRTTAEDIVDFWTDEWIV